MKNPVKGPFRPGLTFGLVFLHAAALAAFAFYPPWAVSPVVLVAALVWWCIRGLCITVGYHRLWTHGGWRCSRAVQWPLAVVSAMALEGSIKDWRRDHRQHHAFTEEDGDPHSPVPWGFWWAHVGWLLWETLPPPGYRTTDTADDDPLVVFQHRWYWPLGVGLGFVLPLALWGLPGLAWCGFIGTVWNLHCTWLVNSAAHLWGERPVGLDGRPYTRDESRNNRWVAYLTFGEGWHGNHHVKQNSAHLGRDRWYDPGYWLIRVLEFLGLAGRVNTFPPLP